MASNRANRANRAYRFYIITPAHGKVLPNQLLREVAARYSQLHMRNLAFLNRKNCILRFHGHPLFLNEQDAFVRQLQVSMEVDVKTLDYMPTHYDNRSDDLHEKLIFHREGNYYTIKPKEESTLSNYYYLMEWKNKVYTPDGQRLKYFVHKRPCVNDDERCLCEGCHKVIPYPSEIGASGRNISLMASEDFCKCKSGNRYETTASRLGRNMAYLNVLKNIQDLMVKKMMLQDPIDNTREGHCCEHFNDKTCEGVCHHTYMHSSGEFVCVGKTKECSACQDAVDELLTAVDKTIDGLETSLEAHRMAYAKNTSELMMKVFPDLVKVFPCLEYSHVYVEADDVGANHTLVYQKDGDEGCIETENGLVELVDGSKRVRNIIISQGEMMELYAVYSEIEHIEMSMDIDDGLLFRDVKTHSEPVTASGAIVIKSPAGNEYAVHISGMIAAGNLEVLIADFKAENYPPGEFTRAKQHACALFTHLSAYLNWRDEDRIVASYDAMIKKRFSVDSTLSHVVREMRECIDLSLLSSNTDNLIYDVYMTMIGGADELARASGKIVPQDKTVIKSCSDIYIVSLMDSMYRIDPDTYTDGRDLIDLCNEKVLPYASEHSRTLSEYEYKQYKEMLTTDWSTLGEYTYTITVDDKDIEQRFSDLAGSCCSAADKVTEAAAKKAASNN